MNFCEHARARRANIFFCDIKKESDYTSHQIICEGCEYNKNKDASK